MRFPGQYYDAESGLIHNGYRDYESATDRYIQSDPIGLNGGPSTYAYVAASPLSFIDPLGLELLTPVQGQQVVNAAKQFVGTPYPHPDDNAHGGGTAASKNAIDCSGLVWKSYNDAGFPTDYFTSSDFPTNPRFQKVDSPQQGDVGQWRGHVLIYDSEAANYPGAPAGANAWSARQYPRDAGPVPTSWWNSLGPVTWYRYNTPD